MNTDKESPLPHSCTAGTHSPDSDLDHTKTRPKPNPQNLCSSVSICGSPDNERQNPPAIEEQSRNNRAPIEHQSRLSPGFLALFWLECGFEVALSGFASFFCILHSAFSL
jgi:hypothetical protein